MMANPVDFAATNLTPTGTAPHRKEEPMEAVAMILIVLFLLVLVLPRRN